MRLLSVFLLFCLAAGMSCFADEESLRRQVQQWVQQLGDESFLVRQRAESLLIRTGLRAYPELQRAAQSRDIEVVRRAEYVLSQIEQAIIDVENPDVTFWIQTYMKTPNPAYKARIIWFLADPVPTFVFEAGFAKCEGLQTLCRLVQFEENDALRLEAAKSLIASPPVSYTQRQKWYRHIRDNLHDTSGSELLQCLAHYAQLWCDMDEAAQATVPTTTPEFQERVRQVGAETLRLLDRPENQIQVGGKVDMLLHYAVAELQDAVGLIEDRDKIVSMALALQPEPIRTPEPFNPVDPGDGQLMYEHFRVGWYLKSRYRLHWATAHFQKVMETGDIDLRTMASDEAAEIAIFFTDYSSAINFFDKHIEILQSPDYTQKRSDSQQRVVRAQNRKTYCLAEKAADAEDWEDVQKILMEHWTMPNAPDDGVTDVDLTILAYRLSTQKEDVGIEFRETMNAHLKQNLQAIEDSYNRTPHDERPAAMVVMGNQAAWLLANTGGDYSSALTLIETSLKSVPDEAGLLDTLAHVSFLGGKVDEAIRTQERVVRMAPEMVVFQQALEQFRHAKVGVSKKVSVHGF